MFFLTRWFSQANLIRPTDLRSSDGWVGYCVGVMVTMQCLCGYNILERERECVRQSEREGGWEGEGESERERKRVKSVRLKCHKANEWVSASMCVCVRAFACVVEWPQDWRRIDPKASLPASQPSPPPILQIWKMAQTLVLPETHSPFSFLSGKKTIGINAKAMPELLLNLNWDYAAAYHHHHHHNLSWLRIKLF